uniref:Ribosomal protein L32 n=1 Tax=Romanomermis culicivorax TaxID=13658 RepID=A0A915JI45_ROMCU
KPFNNFFLFFRKFWSLSGGKRLGKPPCFSLAKKPISANSKSEAKINVNRQSIQTSAVSEKFATKISTLKGEEIEKN